MSDTGICNEVIIQPNSAIADTSTFRQLENVLKREVSENTPLFKSSLRRYDSLAQRYPTVKRRYFLAHYKAEKAYYESNYTKAIGLYKESASLAKLLGEVQKNADALQNIGLCYHYMGDYNAAFNNYQQAVAIYDSLNLSGDLINTYQNIGIIFTDWQKYERSIEFYRKALDINQSHNNLEREAALLQNIGVVFYYWQHYQEAIEHYQRSFKIFKKIKNIQGVGSSYLNLGVVYEDIGQINQALKYYQKAYITLEQFDQPDVLSQLLYNLGNLYYRKDQFDKATDYLNQSLSISKKNNLFNQQVQGLELLATVFEEQGFHQKALKAYKTFHKINDSLYSQEKLNAFDQLVTDYELTAKEKQVERLELERNELKEEMNQQSGLHIWISIVLLVLCIVSGLFIFFYMRQRKLAIQLNKEVKDHQRTTDKLEHIRSQLEIYVKKRTEELWSTNHKLKEAVSKYEGTFQELKIAKEKAEQADKLKSSFLGNMSHEVRTPLNAILGFTQMLASEEQKYKRDEYATYIEEASQNLLHIIEDVLDFSKLESGHMVLREKVFRAQDIIRPLEIHYDKLWGCRREQTLSFSVRYDCDEHVTVKTDRERAKQLLTIFLDNAIKFTCQGAIAIGIKDEGPHVRFYCEDTGLGIAKEHHELIFDYFRQLDIGTTRKFGGNGLGLSLARKIATLLNTKIDLESEPGKGATFSFILPKASVENQDNALTLDYDFSGKVIMVVEDKPMNYYMLEEYLKHTHATLLWCRNGKEAVEMATNALHLDLILMDLQMPVMDGFSATKEIRKRYPTLPIIAQTAYAFKEEEQKCKEAGCTDVVTKPISMKQLLGKIQRYLSPSYV